MAFSVVTATDQDDVLAKIETFAVANGWTSNNNSVDGTGRRLHLQKTGSQVTHSDLFANLRSCDNEVIFGSPALAFTGVGINMSETFDILDGWDEQGAGSTKVYPRDSLDRSRGAVMHHTPSAWPANQSLFLFAHSNPEMIICWAEFEPSKFNWLAFGEMTKQTTFVGGQVFGASFSSEQSVATTTFSIENLFDPFGDTNDHQNCYVRVDADLNTDRWYANATDFSTLRYRGWDFLQQQLLDTQPNQFNGLEALLPILIHITRPASQFSPLGFIDHMRIMNMENRVAKEIVTIGSQDFQIFPWRQKKTQGVNQGFDVGTNNDAVAIKRS